MNTKISYCYPENDDGTEFLVAQDVQGRMWVLKGWSARGTDAFERAERFARRVESRGFINLSHWTRYRAPHL